MQVYLLNFPSSKLPVSITPWPSLRNADFFLQQNSWKMLVFLSSLTSRDSYRALIISSSDDYCSLSSGLKIPTPNIATEILSLICHQHLHPANLVNHPPPWKDLGHTSSYRGSQCIKGLNSILSSCRLSTRNTGKCSKYAKVLALSCNTQDNTHITTVILEESSYSEKLLGEKLLVCPRQWWEGTRHMNLQSSIGHFIHYHGCSSDTSWTSDRLMQIKALGHALNYQQWLTWGKIPCYVCNMGFGACLRGCEMAGKRLTSSCNNNCGRDYNL